MSYRPAVAVIVLALVVVAAAWWSRASDGKRSLAESTAALRRGDRIDAIVYARAAAEARCPWCDAPDLGYSKLYAIAREAESKADDPTAVLAWQAVRAASLATTWIDPNENRRERADQEIARLQHRIDAMSAAAGNASPAASEERLRAVLAPNPLPPTSLFAVLAVGGVLFVAGAIRSVRAHALRAQDIALALAGGAVAVVGVLGF